MQALARGRLSRKATLDAQSQGNLASLEGAGGSGSLLTNAVLQNGAPQKPAGYYGLGKVPIGSEGSVSSSVGGKRRSGLVAISPTLSDQRSDSSPTQSLMSDD
jgi:hypothetical protein